jgi:hypothetical protein
MMPKKKTGHSLETDAGGSVEFTGLEYVDEAGDIKTVEEPADLRGHILFITSDPSELDDCRRDAALVSGKGRHPKGRLWRRDAEGNVRIPDYVEPAHFVFTNEPEIAEAYRNARPKTVVAERE